ncbi:MAG TPA: hypothetical protein ENK42_04680 [Deltaproteobacteria bacterium]|nr:hypothetical protein [Deltaproteobacteria bacterium]
MKEHHHHHEEKLVKISVSIEEDQLALLKELASEYTERLGQRWSVSAMIRLAVGDFLARQGKIA